MKKLLILLLIIISGINPENICLGQLKSPHAKDFYRYLQKEQLYNESLCWLNLNTEKLTPYFFYMESARNLLALQQIDSANGFLSEIDEFKQPQQLELAFETALAVKDTAGVRKLFKNSLYLNNLKNIPDYRLAQMMYTRKEAGQMLSITPQTTDISIIVDRYSGFKNKPGFKAACLSAIIPGSGKWYLGYKHQAKSAFIINIILGAVAVESWLRDAPGFMRISSTSLFSVFYIGNIWGTASLAKKRKYDFYKQINEDIADFFKYRITPY